MKYRSRRTVGLMPIIVSLVLAVIFLHNTAKNPVERDLPAGTQTVPVKVESGLKAIDGLNRLAVKGRAAKTGYSRTQFGDGWTVNGLCDTRNVILNRDLKQVAVDDKCRVMSGVLIDPYTGNQINFIRGGTTSGLVQIDHVVSLSNAWQTGAQQLTLDDRIKLANDPLELLAVDGTANQNKSDGDAATWLPPNKSFRCQYVARQIAVKLRYNLWVTEPEKEAMTQVLSRCPEEQLIAKDTP